MKVSLKWLNDYVNINVSLDELCAKMIMSGFEVDGIEDLSQSMKNVVVGKVNKIDRHPDADRLVVCQIDVGGEEDIQIVTGASNVFEGAAVPVALHGSLLPNGTEIKKGKLRGVVSNGMLCSGAELVIKNSDYEGAEVDGILILTKGEAAGTDMREVLSLDDIIIDFAVTANRPDCLSVLGLAKEVAVALALPITLPLADSSKYQAEESEDVNQFMKVTVEDGELCTRYMGSVVRNIKLQPSPAWMQERLKGAGMRPINNIVDITNFVMLETGQPMHAFDLRDVNGAHIIVRRAEEGEKIVTLDDTEHVLNGEMLVIADELGPSALAGIMGGLNSEIKDDTAEVFFECAQFKRDNVRRTARALGMRTESSARFEKGTDIYNVKYAMDRALQLVELLGAGEIVEGYIDCNSGLPAAKIVEVSPEKVVSLLGVDIPTDAMVDILNRLDIETALKDGALVSKIPSYRGDIDGGADIAEEVMRIYGYSHIAGEPLKGTITRGHVSNEHSCNNKIRRILTGHGLAEISTYSFINDKVHDKIGLAQDDERRRVIPLLNPLTEDYGVMRTQLVSSMLQVLSTNYNRKINKVSFFEIGKVFIPHELPLEKQPEEKYKVSIGVYDGDDKETDFFTVKGYVESLLAAFRLTAKYERSSEEFLHDGREANILVDGEAVGFIGELHPDTADKYGFETRVYLAEIDAEVFYKQILDTVIYKPLPRYPAMERDLALVCDYDLPVAKIEEAIVQSAGKHLENVELFDVYTGVQILAGKKSVAYSLRFRSNEGTLTDEVVDSALKKVFAKLEEIGCSLRS